MTAGTTQQRRASRPPGNAQKTPKPRAKPRKIDVPAKLAIYRKGDGSSESIPPGSLAPEDVGPGPIPIMRGRPVQWRFADMAIGDYLLIPRDPHGRNLSAVRNAMHRHIKDPAYAGRRFEMRSIKDGYRCQRMA